MLLDEHEAHLLDRFEESTIQKKKLLTTFWIIVGILGFISGILLIVMEQIENINNPKEKLMFMVMTLGMSFVFGMLAIFGFKTRISLNNRYGHQELAKIPIYEIYFWLMLFVYFVVLIYLFRILSS